LYIFLVLPCMHQVLHIPHFLLYLTISVKSTSYEAPQFIIFCTPLFLHLF
jgi:hypothetical protein